MSTCTAPGHPDCTIDCDNGCYAVYWEPDGPCDTGCSDSLAKVRIRKEDRISICLQDITASSARVLFEELAAVPASNKKLSLVFRNISGQALLETLRKEMS